MGFSCSTAISHNPPPLLLPLCWGVKNATWPLAQLLHMCAALGVNTDSEIEHAHPETRRRGFFGPRWVGRCGWEIPAIRAGITAGKNETPLFLC